LKKLTSGTSEPVSADQKLAKENVADFRNRDQEGIVYDRDGVKVTAFEVDHGDLIKPAFGFSR